MKKLLAGLALFGFAAGISAETVINFDDGSTYTLTDGQEIYISKGALFNRKIMGNKDTFFRVEKPWASRDFVPTAIDDMQPGSHAWCKAYVPWGEGLTFDMVLWQRSCDTDNDGKYGCGDKTFDASDEGAVCSS
tara:strand:- start:25 stop:426 length:402 start_codon:yes stop_codon:yes gene_type:complete